MVGLLNIRLNYKVVLLKAIIQKLLSIFKYYYKNVLLPQDQCFFFFTFNWELIIHFTLVSVV